MNLPRIPSFSESLGASLAPLLDSLRSVERLVEDLDAVSAEHARRVLVSAREGLESTLETAFRRRPHVLVLGPAKGGKSTLLVAVARAPVTKVSAVSSLPAPVHVVHAPTWSLTLERQDGTRVTTKERPEARLEVQRAHRAWVEGLRAAQRAGRPFDASRDATRAARRVELQAPAPGLADSRIALVEVPSLPSECMSACAAEVARFEEEVHAAVIVLRSEDLARPDALRAFERWLEPGCSAFLVLNLDPGRADLGPAGERLQTWDHEDPVALVESFQALGASAAWLDAFEGGRLRVHLLPLFQLAGRRLAAAGGEGRRVRVPMGPRRPLDPRAPDGLTVLEAELEGALHAGAAWREHVRRTLAGVDDLVGELRGVLEPALAPGPSLEPGRKGLARAAESLGHLRRRVLEGA